MKNIEQKTYRLRFTRLSGAVILLYAQMEVATAGTSGQA